MPSYRILRHPEVEDDLYHLLDLIAGYAGTKVALRKLEEIEHTIASLGDYPHIGSLRHEIYPDLRAIPVADKGVLCFTVDDETRTVYLIAIAYAGSDWMQSIENRT